MELPTWSVIEKELASVEHTIAEEVCVPDTHVGMMGKQLLSAGGKRLRPAIYLLCAKSGEADWESAVAEAAAIELIHMATLVHDDIIDHASIRRGVPTVNACWGNEIAVLSGDYMFAKAFSMISRHSTPYTLEIITDLICRISEGEITQLRNQFNPFQTESDYERRIDKKTASFLQTAAMLGAMAGRLNSAEVSDFSQYGHSIGMAFQMIDDVLDMTATMEEIGKPACSDFRQGILTLPVIYALQHSPQRERLYHIIQTKMVKNTAEEGLSLVFETDGLAYTYARIHVYLQQACTHIPNSVPHHIREVLRGICTRMECLIPQPCLR